MRTNANGEVTVILRLTKKQKTKLDDVLAKKGKAVLLVTPTDLAGNVGTTRQVTVQLS